MDQTHRAIYPGKHKQLFLDDYSTESGTGLSRTLHQPQKHGPVLNADLSAKQTAVQSRSAPQWNPEKQVWEWWYWSFYDEPNATSESLAHYAISSDGVKWEKPSLGLCEGKAHGDNNVISGAGHHDKTVYHVVRDELEENPEKRYKGLFGTKDRWIGFSPDGLNWTMPDISPVPSQDESHLCYDIISNQYLATVKQSTEWGRSVYLATSKNFINWTFPKLIFNTDETDNENRKQRIEQATINPDYLTPPIVGEPPEGYKAQCYQMAIMPYEGLYVGFPALCNPAGPDGAGNNTGLNQIELTVSHDLYNWNRVANRELFIGIDPWDGVNYGTAQILMCGSPTIRDNEVWIYYNGLRFRSYSHQHPNLDPEFFNDGSAMCLAKLRLDGFVSLDAKGEGVLITKPFEFDGDGLKVNAQSNGGLQAELLNAKTYETLPGFSVSESLNLIGDHIDGQIRWGDRTRPENSIPVRVRFHLKDSSLYSFWTL